MRKIGWAIFAVLGYIALTLYIGRLPLIAQLLGLELADASYLLALGMMLAVGVSGILLLGFCFLISWIIWRPDLDL